MKLATLLFAARAALGVTAFIALGGCMSSSPIWDAHFGEAERAVTQAQIIDPLAAQHAPSADGIDGKAAASAMVQYDKSFTQPVVTINPFVIGVSTSGGSSGNGQ